MNEIGAACEIDSRRTGLRCFRGHLAERSKALVRD